MNGLRQSHLFKRIVIAIYWFAVPLCLLGFAGAFFAEQVPFRWVTGAGFGLAAILFGWRLWLYRRALGVAGPTPPMRRALLVLVPLGLLALAGVIVVLSGLFYAAIAIWASLQAAADVGLNLVMLVAGLFVMAVGAVMIMPLHRLLTRRPVVVEASADVFGPAEDTPPS